MNPPTNLDRVRIGKKNDHMKWFEAYKYGEIMSGVTEFMQSFVTLLNRNGASTKITQRNKRQLFKRHQDVGWWDACGEMIHDI